MSSFLDTPPMPALPRRLWKHSPSLASLPSPNHLFSSPALNPSTWLPGGTHAPLLTSDLGLTFLPPPLQVFPVVVEPFQAHDPIMQAHPVQQEKGSHRAAFTTPVTGVPIGPAPSTRALLGEVTDLFYSGRSQ